MSALEELLARRKEQEQEQEPTCQPTDPRLFLELVYQGRVMRETDCIGCLRLLAYWLQPDKDYLKFLPVVAQNTLVFRDWKIIALAEHSGMKEAEVFAWIIQKEKEK